MPKPLSRIQLLWTRLFAPPAPANTRPDSSTASGSSSPEGNWPKFVTACGRSAHAEALMAEKIATTRNSTVMPTLKNCAFSRIW